MRPVDIVSGEAGEGHGRGFDLADHGAEGVELADGAGDDLLKIHAHVGEEMFRKIGAVEADGFIGIVAVVVVPIQQGAGRAGGQTQGVHADHAGDIHFAGART